MLTYTIVCFQNVVFGDTLPDQTLPLSTLDMELEATKAGVRVSVVDADRRDCPPDLDFHTIIFDCSPWSFVDSMGVKVLTAVSRLSIWGIIQTVGL